MTPRDYLDRYLASPSSSTRDAAITAYHYLCKRGAKKFWRPGNDPADLVQVAAIGLIKAVGSFEPAMQTPFEAYAWMLIVGELMHYVRDHERLVRLPRSLRDLERRYVATTEALENHRNQRVTYHEVARELAVSLSVIDELRVLRGGHDMVSLDDADAHVGARFGDSGRRLSLEDRLSLQLAMGELGERERTIVLGLFATGLSQSELAERLGLSQSHISKLKKRALNKLYHAVA